MSKKLDSAHSMKQLTERVIKADLASRNYLRTGKTARVIVTNISTALLAYALIVIEF
jgi:hypothetical protein